MTQGSAACVFCGRVMPRRYLWWGGAWRCAARAKHRPAAKRGKR